MCNRYLDEITFYGYSTVNYQYSGSLPMHRYVHEDYRAAHKVDLASLDDICVNVGQSIIHLMEYNGHAEYLMDDQNEKEKDQ